jgi:methylmalonyl-CoA/ethylmalonyl-CoA epimerase
MEIKRVDHLAILVDSIEASLPFYRDVLGMRLTHTDVAEDQCVVVAFLAAGDSEIELIEPLADECGVGQYLVKRGPGMHHVCLEVDDLDGAMDHLRYQGVQMIDAEPHTGTGGRRIAFIHPKAADGVLIELYETLPGDRAGRRLTNLDDLRRRVLISGRAAAAGTRGFLAALRQSRVAMGTPDTDAAPPVGSATQLGGSDDQGI